MYGLYQLSEAMTHGGLGDWVSSAGQIVCRIGCVITVDGIALGEALVRDRRGRALPVWQGCRAVQSGAFFPMNPQSDDSLDGRYFGPLSATTIVGRAKPLWTEKAH